MAYGEVMKPGIPESSDLTFDVELLSCDKDELADLDVGQMTALSESQTAVQTEETVDEAIAAADPTPDLNWMISNIRYLSKNLIEKIIFKTSLNFFNYF